MPSFKSAQGLHEVTQTAADTYEIDGQSHTISFQQIDDQHLLVRDGAQQTPLYLHAKGDRYQVYYQGEYYSLQRLQRGQQADSGVSSGRISAPLTGKVIEVSVTVGQELEAGLPLLILESMKMETALTSPFAARVLAVHCQAGDQVANEQLLIELESLNPPAEIKQETAINE